MFTACYTSSVSIFIPLTHAGVDILLVNLPGNQYNIYMYVVRGEMLKQTSLTIYCAIIKDVKIQKYIF